MATAPFTPLNNFVIIQCKAPGERRTATGLVMPGSMSGNFIEAKVLAVSEGVEIEGTTQRRRPRVRAGQRVHVVCTAPGTLPGLPCDPGNQEVRLVEENEIVGVSDDEA